MCIRDRCGTGIEIPGLVTVRLTVIKQAHLKLPVLETTDKWYTLGNAKEFPEALQKTTQAMQDLLIKAYGWDAVSYTHLDVYKRQDNTNNPTNGTCCS